MPYCAHWRSVESDVVGKLSKLNDSVEQLSTPSCQSCSSQNTKLHICLHDDEPELKCESCMNKHFGEFPDHYVYGTPADAKLACNDCRRTIKMQQATTEDELQSSKYVKSTKTYLNAIHNGLQLLVDPTVLYLANPQGGLCGLSNVGNTCFLSATIQCIVHCPAIISIFVNVERELIAKHFAASISHSSRPDLQSDTAKHQEGLCREFGRLVVKMWGGKYSSCLPRDLLKYVWALHPFFRGYAQHDAHEFMRAFLDSLHEGLLIRTRYDYLHVDGSLANSHDDTEMEEEDDAKEEKGKDDGNGKKRKEVERVKTNGFTGPEIKPGNDTSLISDLFQGAMSSRIVCGNCGAQSVTCDPFWDISLELPKTDQMKKIEEERGAHAVKLREDYDKGWFGGLFEYIGISQPPLSIYTCLHSFCTSADLAEGNQYKCEKCKQKVNATKHIAIRTFPKMLCVQLKRFSHSTFHSKLTRHVQFPLDSFDLAPFAELQGEDAETKTGLSSSSNAASKTVDTMYNLVGLIRHMGGSGGFGHYIAFARHHVTQEWFRFDDKVVTKVSPETVKEQEAYVLFYQQHTDTKQQHALLHKLDTLLQRRATVANTPRTDAVLLSQRWVRKSHILGGIAAVDNRDLCCPHGVPSLACGLPSDTKLADPDEMTQETATNKDAWPLTKNVMTLARSDYNDLIASYGGGPCIPMSQTALQECPICILPVIRQQERAEVTELDASGVRDKYHYIIHADWLQSWRHFITKNGPRPGAVSNHELLKMGDEYLTWKTQEPRELTVDDLKSNLVKSDDYRSLHRSIFMFLVEHYGGGPAIVTTEYDIESELIAIGEVPAYAAGTSDSELSEDDEEVMMDSEKDVEVEEEPDEEKSTHEEVKTTTRNQYDV